MKTFNSIVFSFLFLISNYICAKNFNIINGVTIIDIADEHTGLPAETLRVLTSKNYINPNERNPHFYQDILAESTGILLSVGTFRGLIALSLGKFDRLIMLDVANPILDFNRYHLEFIEKLAQTYPDSLAEQRIAYKTNFETYLNRFAPSDTPYYWDDDLKWQKIIGKIRNDKVHVIRGNLAHAEANRVLIGVLAALRSKLTIDLSNVAQYVDPVENLSKGLDAFSETSVDNNVSVLATFQADLSKNPFSEYFAIGEDSVRTKEQERAGIVDWIYYYFPYLQHYKDRISRTELTNIELHSDDMVPTLAGFFISVFKQIKKRKNFSNEVIINLLREQIALFPEKEIKEKIFKSTYEKFIVPELSMRALVIEPKATYEEALSEGLNLIGKDNFNYLINNKGAQKPGSLGFFF